MEQKRTLLIVAAVGIFLLVVLGAAIILNSASSAASNEPIENPSVQVTSDWITPDSQVSTISSVQDLNGDSDIISPAENGGITSDSIITTDTPMTSDNGIIYPASGSYTTTGADGTTSSSTLSTTVTPSTAQNPTTTVQITQNSYSTQQSQPVTVITPKPVSVTPKPVATDANKKSTASASTKKTTAAPAKKFWVQVGSFSKKNGAETTRQSLSAQGIQSEIFTYTTDDGATGFRVRVGPYQTRSEAEYWMKLVEEKTGTKGYITETK